MTMSKTAWIRLHGVPIIAGALLGLGTQAHAIVGATTPFVSYEAEAGTLGGGAVISSLTSPPTNQYSSPELEASGHSYVKLTGTGQYVQWTNNTGHNISAINLRACIPDSSGGGGITATLNLYVNGTLRQALNLNSKQTWLYEGTNYQGNDQSPSLGAPRVFFDDIHTFIGTAITPGSTIKLQKDAANTAAFYYIDVIDVEDPPAALAQPANSLSIASYGATANNTGFDNTTAIQNCINAAHSQGKIVWIPTGTWYVKTTGGINASGVTIQGAGPWYSTVYRNMALPYNNGGLGAIFNLTSCTVKNFALDSNATSRASVDGCGGGMDTTGTNWLADNIWTQHTMSGFWASGTGGTVQNCRLTSIWADGCNLNNVALTGTVGNNLTAKNNFIRGTGDDGTVFNSVNYNGSTTYTPMSGCKINNCTVIGAWGGKCVAIYGGSNQTIQDNYMSDTARYIGLGIGKFGTNGSDLTSGTVTGNVVVRCGGNGFNQGQPALHIGNGGDGQGVGNVGGVTVSNNLVLNSLYDGIGFSTSSNIILQNNVVSSPGRNGIVIQPPFYPAPSGSASIQTNTVSGLSGSNTAYINNSGGYSATVGGNSWQVARKLVPGTNVSLQAVGANSKYVTAPNTTNPLIASASTVGAAETFAVVDMGGGKIALRNTATNQYVCADSAGASALIANRPSPGAWETFMEVVAGSGNIALMAMVNDQYVTAENAGANPLIANRTAVGGWETFAAAPH